MRRGLISARGETFNHTNNRLMHNNGLTCARPARLRLSANDFNLEFLNEILNEKWRSTIMHTSKCTLMPGTENSHLKNFANSGRGHDGGCDDDAPPICGSFLWLCIVHVHHAATLRETLHSLARLSFSGSAPRWRSVVCVTASWLGSVRARHSLDLAHVGFTYLDWAHMRKI